MKKNVCITITYYNLFHTYMPCVQCIIFHKIYMYNIYTKIIFTGLQFLDHVLDILQICAVQVVHDQRARQDVRHVLLVVGAAGNSLHLIPKHF